MSHTKGPWRIGNGSDSDGYFGPDRILAEREGCSRFVVAEANWHFGEESRANARLIAAAPELLEACRVVKEFLANLENGTRRDDPLRGIRPMTHAPLHRALDAAIAKATCGGSGKQEPTK